MKIGVDLGGSHIAVGVVTQEGNLLVSQEENLSLINNENVKQLIRDKILSLISCVLKQMELQISSIKEIGIGIPGIIKENIIEKCEKYGIYNWDLAREIEEFYKTPVKLQNDALCASKAEYKYGNLKNVKKGVFLCLGTGIGGATILGKDIFSSEYGHMVINLEGTRCHCNKKGCFETYSSMRAFKIGMIELLRLDKNTTSEELLNILRKQQDNNDLNSYIDKYITTLSIGISNIVNIIGPEKICIGGSFTYFEDVLFTRLLEKIDNMKYQFEKPEIVLAKLQNTAGIIGAVL